eukprot:COSAG05_NODE_1813_length_4036_cov_463.816358_2_plen_65_part_00
MLPRSREFEGDAPHSPTFIKSRRGFIESVARDELPEHVTVEFEDDEPGVPCPTQNALITNGSRS